MKEITIKVFNIDDATNGTPIAENIKTFEEAEALIIAHDKKMHADWVLKSYQHPERTEEFKHHRYLIYHTEGKVVTDDISADMPFAELCDEAFGWRAISVVEFKF